MSVCNKFQEMLTKFICHKQMRKSDMSKELCIYHMFADSIVFEQLIYCSFFIFADTGGGGKKIGHFLWMS